MLDWVDLECYEANDGRGADLRYTYYRRAGSNEFTAVVELPDGAENPLFGIEAARELQATVAKWALGEPPAARPLEVLGSYRR